MKGKNLHSRILYLARLSFRFEGEIESFTAPPNQLYKKCSRDFSKQKRRGHNYKHENYERKKLIGKANIH